jgi:hypothetical protein
VRPTLPLLLDFSLLRYLQCVIYLDPKVSNSALQLAMAKQELDGPQVLGSLVDQCRLSPSHGVRAIDR